MLSSAECHAKANDAVRHAAAADNPAAKEHWQSTVHEWLHLAGLAATQEALQQALIDRTHD